MGKVFRSEKLYNSLRLVEDSLLQSCTVFVVFSLKLAGKQLPKNSLKLVKLNFGNNFSSFESKVESLYSLLWTSICSIQLSAFLLCFLLFSLCFVELEKELALFSSRWESYLYLFCILVKIAAMTFLETPTLAIPVLTNMSVSFRTFFILAMNSLHVSFSVVHRVIKQTIKANLTKSSVEEFAI